MVHPRSEQVTPRRDTCGDLYWLNSLNFTFVSRVPLFAQARWGWKNEPKLYTSENRLSL